MTPSPITPGDSLAAVVAELDTIIAQHRLHGDPCLWTFVEPMTALRDRIERLDAEMRKERQAWREIAGRRGKSVAPYLLEIKSLRAKLAACERDATRYWFLRAGDGCDVSIEEADDDGDMVFVGGYEAAALDEAIDIALASRAAGET